LFENIRNFVLQITKNVNDERRQRVLKRLPITAAVAAALAAACVYGEWVFEGKWGSYGNGSGEFQTSVVDVAVAPNGNVYTIEDAHETPRVQYFTASGSFLGKWGSYGTGNGEFGGLCGVAVC
jgi:hypothetical protein